MSEHFSLYRKYRPQDFSEVKNQDHIVGVLEGAIKKGEIPHALLFSGSRGTGKTTLARIFAKALGVSSVDLYEIDAASNRGIDDIRELKDAVHTLPYESRYKVYIIDEVHMLTKEAFNALLKTLEEPPSHVVFILATTEEEKLLDTILSRCQVFRFRAPSRPVLASTVTEVAKKEGFTLPKETADLIAVAADGSFRDALGITQKVMLASGDKVGTVDEVAMIIGAPKESLLLDLLDSLNTNDTAGALQVIEKAIAGNVEMKIFARLLLEQVRAVMLVRHQKSRASEILANFSEAAAEKITTLAQEAKSPINSQLLLSLLSATEQINFSPLPHLPLEIAILQLAKPTV